MVENLESAGFPQPSPGVRSERKVYAAAAGPVCNIDVRFFTPPADLEGCFTTFYRMELSVGGGAKTVDHLQPEYGNLRFFSGSAPDCRIAGSAPLADAPFTVTGPSSLPLRFELGKTRMWGVGLFPLGWARFTGVPASDFANRVIDGALHPAFQAFAPLAKQLFGDSPNDDAEFGLLIDAFRRNSRKVRDEAAIHAVHAAVVDTNMSTVAELAGRAGLAARSLERLCRRYFGFPPKLLLRRQRMMRTLVAFMLDDARNWSSVIDGRYHDQAHFVREFHAFMGMTPSEFAALDHPVMSAFMAERKRILGSPAQTLDEP